MEKVRMFGEMLQWDFERERCEKKKRHKPVEIQNVVKDEGQKTNRTSTTWRDGSPAEIRSHWESDSQTRRGGDVSLDDEWKKSCKGIGKTLS